MVNNSTNINKALMLNHRPKMTLESEMQEQKCGGFKPEKWDPNCYLLITESTTAIQI